ncbi:TetR/AcrR family transcriptional regulator [Bacillaceae bacterium Marseille-Q3522]|nr:TetR/AcrR family transcriptional regulator [Bacillaceae bacterium Marseille-Q3522]
MPKIVDHEKRRKQIAEATWRIILDMGMEGATVRNIAKEANLSLGAVRHYFSTQDELLEYTMELVKEKAAARINAIMMRDIPMKEKVLNILLEMVPTNKETLAETEVWLTFTFYARKRKELFNPQHDGILNGLKKLIDYLDKAKLLKNSLDKDIETERLYALIDGLAVHAILEPDRLTKKRISQVLVQQIDLLWADNPDENGG